MHFVLCYLSRFPAVNHPRCIHVRGYHITGTLLVVDYCLEPLSAAAEAESKSPLVPILWVHMSYVAGQVSVFCMQSRCCPFCTSIQSSQPSKHQR